MEDITFDKLNLSKTTFDAITKKGYSVASEIQAKIIPIIFEQKNDVIGVAQTGTGKTGAFGLPLIDMINEGNKLPQSIILAPTRELALQVTSELEMFSGKKRLNILTVYGGTPISTQMKSLKRGVDIVVGTPGRVVDLINRRCLILKECRYFILDEADEMLKMGFIEDIEFILGTSSEKRKVYLFSATMPQRIKQLSKKYMKNQIIIEAEKKKEVNNLIEQGFYKARQSEKFDALTRLIGIEDFFYGIVFCRTRADVDKVSSQLKKEGYEVDCIHGDIIQSKRERILNKFKDQKLSILVATDVAARGIDVNNLSHVINYSLPEDVETYTHRIGRTGRAGNKGKAISLVTPAEMRRITQIERTLKTTVKKLQLPTQSEVRQKEGNRFFVEIDNIIEKVDVSSHSEITEKLLEKHEPKKLISALLHKIDNKSKKSEKSERSESRFERSESRFERKDSKFDRGRDFNRGNSRSTRGRPSTSKDEIRVFIAKGKMDKMDRKGLIRFIERETRVKLGRVNDVKVCDKFSFMTLNSKEAYDVVEAFESKGGRRPLAEIAQK